MRLEGVAIAHDEQDTVMEAYWMMPGDSVLTDEFT